MGVLWQTVPSTEISKTGLDSLPGCEESQDLPGHQGEDNHIIRCCGNETSDASDFHPFDLATFVRNRVFKSCCEEWLSQTTGHNYHP